MVKIKDPRCDTAAIAMRSLRADNTFKIIKKIIKKYKSFDEDKLGLNKIDISFYEDFISSPESIKQELIFLWEEIGDLCEELQKKNIADNDSIILNINAQEKPIPPKSLNVMGP